MSVKIEPIDSIASLSSPSNVVDLVVHSSNGSSSELNSSIDGCQSGNVVTSSATTLLLDQKSRDLETTVISLAPAQPYPAGTLAFAQTYDLSGQPQYTVQVSFLTDLRK